ncbi:histidine kinase dimerization/phospho-acceptor domain-containing protein [Peribacillus butanolivorans]|uniref:histidine kinase dimerization/phospho-acceptor domain-containing protein n=1 Tax=Peribacillus butanolivorans TaxID=421767 RepID=UPI0038052F6A
MPLVIRSFINHKPSNKMTFGRFLCWNFYNLPSFAIYKVVAHEIRNPLITIKGFFQLYKKENKSALLLSKLERIETITSELRSLGNLRLSNYSVWI